MKTPEEVYMKRRIREQDYRKRKYEKLNHTYDCGIWYKKDKNGHKYYTIEPTRNKKWIRRYNNKRIRRYKGDISDGADYRKLNEHWWIIY